MSANLQATARDGRRRRREAGFTLVEMSIVLLIVGLLVGMFSPLLGQMLENARTASTEGHLDAIEEAIIVHVRRTGRIPCPAQPEDAPLGTENATCTGADAEGIVPFRTLGLSEDVAFDGYKNYFTYRVQPDYADSGLNSDITLGFCTETTTLRVEDENNVDLAPGQEVVFVLVSHGENGFGRFNPPAVAKANAGAGDADEDENDDADDTFIRSLPVANGYDDTIRWNTRDQLANEVKEFGCP